MAVFEQLMSPFPLPPMGSGITWSVVRSRLTVVNMGFSTSNPSYEDPNFMMSFYGEDVL